MIPKKCWKFSSPDFEEGNFFRFVGVSLNGLVSANRQELCAEQTIFIAVAAMAGNFLSKGLYLKKKDLLVFDLILNANHEFTSD